MNKRSIISSRRSFLDRTQGQLRLLELDLQLKQEGYSYSYVVDFSAIYSYVYRTLTARSLPPLQGERMDRAFARRQVALKLIFSDQRRPLLLIPPYAAELRNHLNLISMQTKLAGTDLKEKYVRTLRNLIQQSGEFKSFLQTDRPDPKSNSQAARMAALEVGKKYFPELYTVVSCSVVKSIDLFRDLFTKRILKDAELELPQMKDFGYESSEEVSNRWYRELLKLRTEDRAFQTFVDALACAYIEIANSRLNSDKRIVVFVSPSTHVQKAIGAHRLIKTLTDSSLSVVRDLEYFLLLFTHREDLLGVRDTLRLTNELLRAYGQTEDRRGVVAVRSREVLDKSEAQWQLAENRLLLTDSTLLDEAELPGSGKTVDDAFLAVLRMIAEAARSDSSEFEREAKELISSLRDSMIRLDRMVPASHLTAVLSDLAVQRHKKKLQVQFPALQDEMPIMIEFSDEGVAGLAERLAEIESNHGEKMAVALRQEIMQLAAKGDSTAESCLLAAYILAMESKLDAALAEVTNCSSANRPGKKKELYYLAAVIYRKLTQPIQAKEYILQALREDGDEPRFHVECGRILWQMSVLRPCSPDLNLLEDALTHCNLALTKLTTQAHDVGLRAQANNALAYIYCDLGLRGGPKANEKITLAEQHFLEIKNSLPQNQWIGRFYDTGAWISYAKAILDTQKPSQTRQMWLTQARSEIDRALEHSKSGGAMELLLHSHKIHIMEALENLAPKAT